MKENYESDSQAGGSVESNLKGRKIPVFGCLFVIMLVIAIFIVIFIVGQFVPFPQNEGVGP